MRLRPHPIVVGLLIIIAGFPGAAGAGEGPATAPATAPADRDILARAGIHFERGSKFSDDRQYAEAAREYTEALDTLPQEIPYASYRAQILWSLVRARKAESEQSRTRDAVCGVEARLAELRSQPLPASVANERPQMDLLAQELAWACAFQRGDTLLAAKRPGEAASAYIKALKAVPEGTSHDGDRARILWGLVRARQAESAWSGSRDEVCGVEATLAELRELPLPDDLVGDRPQMAQLATELAWDCPYQRGKKSHEAGHPGDAARAYTEALSALPQGSSADGDRARILWALVRARKAELERSEAPNAVCGIEARLKELLALPLPDDVAGDRPQMEQLAHTLATNCRSRPDPKPTRPLVVAGGILTGLGLASLGGMTASLVLGGQASMRLKISEPGDERHDVDRDGVHANHAAIATGILGGVMTAVGAALLAVGRKQARRVAVAPVLRPASAGLSVQVAF